MEKYYVSDHLLGYGNFVVVTTAQEIPGTRDIIAEAWVFGLNIQGIFDGKVIKYSYRNGDEEVADIDLDFMEQQAQNAARNIISEYQRIKYDETKDIDYLKENIEFQDCKKDALITIKNNGYRQELEHISKDTHSPELRKYLEQILAFKIEIRPYGKNPEINIDINLDEYK